MPTAVAPILSIGKRFERRFRRLVLARLAGAASHQEQLELARVHRVLLIRANFRLGNLVLALPALPALRAVLPDAPLDVLCGRGFATLLDGHPDVDTVLTVDRRSLTHPLHLWRLARRLRAARYDLVVDGGRGSSFLGAMLARLSGGRWRAANAGCRYEACFNVLAPHSHRRHKLDLLLDMLDGLGIPPAEHAPRLHLRPDEMARAAAALDAWGTGPRPLVGISMAGRSEKGFPHAQIAALANQLVGAGSSVVVFPGPEEQHRAAALRPQLRREVRVAPLLPIREFAAVIALLDVFVTADSGPMHVAAAVGTRVVTAVRSLTAPYFVPRGPRHRAVLPDPAHPVADLAAAIAELLAAEPPAAVQPPTAV
ncbi:MAG: glycosyltransferase family 9 protein [bacterium]|nr:glycosyltransferase family 9 protein [bacterium]